MTARPLRRSARPNRGRAPPSFGRPFLPMHGHPAELLPSLAEFRPTVPPDARPPGRIVADRSSIERIARPKRGRPSLPRGRALMHREDRVPPVRPSVPPCGRRAHPHRGPRSSLRGPRPSTSGRVFLPAGDPIHASKARSPPSSRPDRAFEDLPGSDASTTPLAAHIPECYRSRAHRLCGDLRSSTTRQEVQSAAHREAGRERMRPRWTRRMRRDCSMLSPGLGG